MTGDENLYVALGGLEGCRKLSVAFYARVAHDAVLSPLFTSTFNCAIRALTDFLAQSLGGDPEYSKGHSSLSLRESHAHLKIGPKERDAWMTNMVAALEDVPVQENAREALRRFFEQGAAYLAKDKPHATVEPPWDVQIALDEAIAAVRSGDATRALAQAEDSKLQDYFKRDPAALLSLLELMSRHTGMLTYVRQILHSNPAFARTRYAAGRTLLHGAAGAGSLSIVDLLLHLGADPNATDLGGHAPLYSVGNESSGPDGGAVVRALVQAGADVNARGGVQHCTALHMAARRGNVEVARALLACGADPEARDIRGDTPLRRSIKCRKPAMTALLRSVS